MNYDEDQQMELEALEAIFLHDYCLESENPRVVRLRLLPFPGEDEENHVGIYAIFRLPETYPEVVPEITIEAIKGLNPKIRQELETKTCELAVESIGMPMIFTLAESLKEWLDLNNKDHSDESMHAQMIARMDAEKKEKDEIETAARVEAEKAEDLAARKRRVEGTPVTAESFVAWLAKFIQEQEEIKKQEEESLLKSGGKQSGSEPIVTGRQYFENQAATFSAGDQPMNEWDDETEIQEDLFIDEDDEDLDDLDSSEEDDEEEEDDE